MSDKHGSSDEWIHRLVRLLDDGFRIPGTNITIGLDPLLGLALPGIGDAVTALGAIAVFLEGVRRGVPANILVKMAFNVAMDVLIGMVPVVGDIFDWVWKANRRNLDLIEKHATDQHHDADVVDSDSSAQESEESSSSMKTRVPRWLWAAAIVFGVLVFVLPLLLFGAMFRFLW